MAQEPFLIADIGGTNARFALTDPEGRSSPLGAMHSFRARDFPSLESAVAAYFAAAGARPRRACFAVAGPVTDPVIEFTNSPWVLDIAAIKRRFAFEELFVVNDFQALAAGVRSLRAGDFVEVKGGSADPAAPVLVIGPGTGFGQALIIAEGERERIVPTEGGHVGFAPHTDEEIEILRFLAREHGRVSLERVVSGGGMVNIYRALCARTGSAPRFDDGQAVTAAGLSGSDENAGRALSLFCALLGAAAGDAVLATGARGGVVLGGGILPKIREVFLSSLFTERFCDKGRMSDFVGDVPVRLIIQDGAALLGAAAILRDRLPTAGRRDH